MVASLVKKPISLSCNRLMAMLSQIQITRLDCFEDCSCITKWTGVLLALVLDRTIIKPEVRFPEVRFIVFPCLNTI